MTTAFEPPAMPDRALAGEPVEELVAAVRELSAARTVDDVATIVRGAARRLTGADGATFVLREDGNCHYVDEDAISPLWKGKRFPLSACISGWAMLHQQAVAIEDIYADDRIPHDAYRPTFVRSLVMVPIRTSDPVGAIGNYWATPRQPTHEEIRLLQALADSTAVAMENVSLYSHLEAMVDARTAALEAANEELRQFTAALAHDVRSPLTTIMGYADLLATRHSSQLDDRGLQAVAALEGAAENLTQFVADLLSYATAGNQSPDLRLVDVRKLVDDVAERLHHQIDERGACIECSPCGEFVGDRVLLSQVVQNLVANALAYVPDGRSPVVRVAVRDAGSEWWELSVADNGAGVPVDEREQIFQAFRRGTTGHHRRGTGLGLALCRKVAELHGGSIWVEDSDAGGAAFVMRLPKPNATA